MKAIVIVALSVGLFGGVAMAQSLGEKTGVNAVIGTAPSTQDFVTEAAISDMFEIESSKLAQSKAQDASIKTFAGKMIEDHTKTTTELKGLLDGGKVKATAPAEMDSAHKSKLDKLGKLNGKDFDKQYASDQQSAHKDAVSLFDRYAKGGDNADLKAWAGKTEPHLKMHLDMANGLKP
jgi:putative membrane protein